MIKNTSKNIIMTTYKHLLDAELQKIYDELTDEQKLTLCLRDFRVEIINKVAYRLGIDIDDLEKSFQDEYDDLLERVAYEELLIVYAEEVIEECACWVNWLSYCDSQDIVPYLND